MLRLLHPTRHGACQSGRDQRESSTVTGFGRRQIETVHGSLRALTIAQKADKDHVTISLNNDDSSFFDPRVVSCPTMRTFIFSALCVFLTLGGASAGQTQPPDRTAFDEETMRHYQALLRFDTTDPPGNEKPASDYLKQILEKEGIPTNVVFVEPNRPNVVARLKRNGRKRPLLVMAHTDVVSVDARKWTFPPFSATRNGGYVYGRGTVDDKDNVGSAIMTALNLKRVNVPV